MANYRTAMGKSVDMAALTAKNEKTRAVGNMKVNARGDVINDAGLVTHAKPQQLHKQYSQQVQVRKGKEG